MRKLRINRIDLEMVFEPGNDESSAYLDTETGAVILVENALFRELEDSEDIEAVLLAKADLADWQRRQLLDAARIEADTVHHYRQLPKQNSRAGYQDMQEYIWSLEDERLREQLEEAIQGSGAFRRFNDMLSRYPEVKKHWFRFRDERVRQRMSDWLASEGIEAELE